MYTVRGEGSSSKVKNLVTHFFVTCDDDSSVASANSVMERERLRATVIFFKVMGVIL